MLDCLICLPCADAQPPGFKALVAAGEGFTLEFKSSLRYNIKVGRHDSAIEHAVLKTVSAFLNSAGGTLLIGVNDAGLAVGVEQDGFPNDDKFMMHFWNLVKAAMGQDACAWIRMDLEKTEGATVAIVRCRPSPKPVFLAQKGFDEEF